MLRHHVTERLILERIHFGAMVRKNDLAALKRYTEVKISFLPLCVLELISCRLSRLRCIGLGIVITVRSRGCLLFP